MQLHSAFYKFVELADPDAIAELLRDVARELTGSILVAGEGINGVVAGTSTVLDAFEAALAQDARFSRAFTGITFKRSACTSRPFFKMRVHVKKEIVAFGVTHVKAHVEADVKGAANGENNASPAQWRELITRDDVVVIDNRNSFEYRLGKFKGAIDPRVPNFRDFPKYVEANAPAWKAEGKTVAMYCTGGIRCEKSSAWMHDLGLNVVQLEGGILNYFQAMPDAEKDWEGECFVFDNRIAIDTKLQETATTYEDVYAEEPDGEWRIARARRLDLAG